MRRDVARHVREVVFDLAFPNFHVEGKSSTRLYEMARSPLKRKRESSKIDIDYPLKKVFQKQAFRPLQREIIVAALEGHDIFVQAATSFGKSLCFQLPAWCSKGVTVVISPLLALMQNQVFAAKKLGIATESITGSTTIIERATIEADLQCGHPYTRLLYVTPELCATERFRKILRRLHQQGQLIRVAVDEAHCISEWGHDFRPAYKELKWLKNNLQCPSTPIMALTATATPKVREDIYKYLNFKHEKTLFFSTTTARPNIHYEIQYFSESNPRDSSGDDIFAYLHAWLISIHRRRVMMLKHYLQQPQLAAGLDNVPLAVSGIIYVNTRNLTEGLASKLQSAGISAQAYHAGLEPSPRLKLQNNFIRISAVTMAQTRTLRPANGDLDDQQISGDLMDISKSFNIIVATNAFGMGIDIPTIRFVVHYGLPRNLESFIQESGRAGRDNKASQSLVLYTREERDRTVYRVKMDIQKEMSKQQNKNATALQFPMANARLNSQFDPSPGTQPALQADQKMKSLQKVIEYCENTSVCRHKLITDYFGQPSAVSGAASSRSIAESGVKCDYACDVCKESANGVKKRRDKGLASDEEASQYTQQQNWDYD